MAEAVKTPEQAPVVEKQANCLSCNKPLKRLKLYYRDGKYYCTKKCWRKYLTDKQKEAQK